MFKPTTVDAALAPLLKTIANLEHVSTGRLENARGAQELARKLNNEADQDFEESKRAELILTKLRTLTEG